MSALEQLMQEVNKKFKKTVMSSGLPKFEGEKIPFSSMRLNYMTYGGIPRGSLTEFFGEENGGKTTTALDIVANAQKIFNAEAKRAKKQPLKVLWIDAEGSLKEDWANTLGVDTNAVQFFQPSMMAAEDILETAISAVNTGEVGLLVIDSIGGLMSRKEMEGTVEDKQFCGVADQLRKFVNKVRPVLLRNRCACICINQLRDNVGAQYPSTKTPGGRSYKHALDLRLQFQKGVLLAGDGTEQKQSYDAPVGNQVMVSIAKTRVCRPNRRAGFYTLNYESGVDNVSDLVDLCIKIGLISKSGAWFELVDGKTGEMLADEDGEVLKLQGRAAVLKFLRENKKIYEEMREYAEKKIAE